jgi:1-acyl-sn-glycerol-3-phosphate acyltransferase
MIRTFFLLLWTVLATAFFSTMAILISWTGGNADTIHKIGRIWAKCLLSAANIKVTVKGISSMNPRRSCIYMPNHMSNLDIPVLQAYLPVQFRWLAKAELFKIPVFGQAMQRAGYISIDRSDRKSAIQSLHKAAKIIKEGVSVIIFPEGTRSRNHRIQPFKKGGFVLAIDSGVPIVPITIRGTWPIMHKKRMRIKPGNVVVEIAKPIESSKYTRETKDDLMDKVRNIIMESFKEELNNGGSC